MPDCPVSVPVSGEKPASGTNNVKQHAVYSGKIAWCDPTVIFCIFGLYMGHDGTTCRPFEGLRSAGGVEGPSGFGLPDVTDTPAGQAVEPTAGVLD